MDECLHKKNIRKTIIKKKNRITLVGKMEEYHLVS